MSTGNSSVTIRFERTDRLVLDRIARSLEGIRHAQEDVAPDYPRQDGDYTVLGPELFTDGNVISWKGTNYYRACDALVLEKPDGGATHCVKRANHPSGWHEDYEGHVVGVED